MLLRGRLFVERRLEPAEERRLLAGAEAESAERERANGRLTLALGREILRPRAPGTGGYTSNRVGGMVAAGMTRAEGV